MIRQGTAATPRETGHAVVAFLVGLVVVLGAYVGLAWLASDRMPPIVAVGGVDVGGESPAQATTKIESAVAARLDSPVVISVGDKALTLDPTAAGLGIDVGASMADLTGFSLNPIDIIHRFFGAPDRPFATTVDDTRLTSALTSLAAEVDVPATEGSITLPEGHVNVVAPEPGRTLEITETAAKVREAWPQTKPVQAVVAVVEPAVSAATIESVRTAIAVPAMSAPITVRAGTQAFTVAAADLAPALSFVPEGDQLVLEADDPSLIKVVTEAAAAAGVTKDPVDAAAKFSGTTATVAPHQDGVALDTSTIVKPVTDALTAGNRTATVKVTVIPAKTTTEMVKAVLPKEKISSFTTYYKPGQSRVKNIQLAARTLNGTYIAPGEQFSLNGVLGQRTPEKGYVKAGTIVNSRLVDNYGGGISQLSTTIFNAAFFAGVKYDEYRAHSYYISRYPEGRESTLSWGTIDLRWTNDTKGGILVRAHAGSSSVTVEFHGIKTWDIKATKSPRRNITQPKTYTDDSKTCIPMSPTEGFDVTVTRIFQQAGKTVKTEKFNTHYDPENKVTCTYGEPTPPPPAD